LTVILYATLIAQLGAAFTRLSFFMLIKYYTEHKLQSTVFYSFFFRNSIASSRLGPDSLVLWWTTINCFPYSNRPCFTCKLL